MFQNTGSNLFGGSAAQTTAGTGLFGTQQSQQQPSGGLFSSTGGFGTTTPSTGTTGLFGTTTQPQSTLGSGGLFGSQANRQPTATGGGLFGSTTSQPSGTTSLFGTTTPSTMTSGTNLFGSSALGGTSTTGGLFGSAAPATTSTGGLFGSSQPTTTLGPTTSFGTTPGVGLFGSTTTPTSSATTTSAFGTTSVTTPKGTGTRDVRYREEYNKDTMGRIQAITYLPEISQTKTIEELRWEDYCLGLTPGKTPATATPPSSTAATLGTGAGFGSTTTAPTTTGGLFGSSTQPTTGGLFGSSQPTTTGGLFGSGTMSTGGGLFGSGATANRGGLFGSTASTTTPSAGGGLFGSTATQPSKFGTTGGGLFGATTAPAATGTTSGGLFGSTTAPSTGGGGLFGASTQPTTGGLFGSTQTGGLFGTAGTAPPAQPASGGLFGSGGTTPGGGLFGQTTTAPGGGGLFGTKPATSGGLFGTTTTGLGATGGGLFGSGATTQSTGGLFGTQPTGAGGLGTATTGGLFGSKPSTTPALSTGGLFGSSTAPSATTGGLFGTSTPSAPGGGLFGKPSATSTGTSLFGTTPPSSNLLAAPTGTGLFGGSTGLGTAGTTGVQSQPTPGLFGSSSLFGTSLPQNAAIASQPTPGLFQNIPSTGTQQQQQLQQPLVYVDPYGFSRLYNSGMTSGGLLLGGLSSTLPNPFAFPASGVILPTHYRRYKSATFAQIWRPLPEYSTEHRRQPLPSLTPKRILRQRASAQSAGLTADYGWSDPALTGFVFPLPPTPGPTSKPRTSLRGRGEWTPFRPQAAAAGSDEEGAAISPTATYRDGTTTRSTLPRRLRTKCTEGQDTTTRPFHQYQDHDAVWSASLHGTPRRQRGIEPGDLDARTAPSWLSQSLLRSRLYGGGRTVTTPYSGGGGGLEPSTSEYDEATRGNWSDKRPIMTGSERVHRYNGISETEIIGSMKPHRESGQFYDKEIASATRQAGRFSLKPLKGISAAFVKDGIVPSEEDLAPICSREGYTTRPSIETLESYSESRLAAVEDFSVIREGFGEITWPGLTDVRGLNIDGIVLIEDRAVEVYPEEYLSRVGQEPPEVGIGLNKPALITLYNCWPKEGQLDERAEDYKATYEAHVRRMRRYTEKLKGHFISISPQGVWRFRVDHFSRYAFEDNHQEEERTLLDDRHTQFFQRDRIESSLTPNRSVTTTILHEKPLNKSSTNVSKTELLGNTSLNKGKMSIVPLSSSSSSSSLFIEKTHIVCEPSLKIPCTKTKIIMDEEEEKNNVLIKKLNGIDLMHSPNAEDYLKMFLEPIIQHKPLDDIYTYFTKTKSTSLNSAPLFTLPDIFCPPKPILTSQGILILNSMLLQKCHDSTLLLPLQHTINLCKYLGSSSKMTHYLNSTMQMSFNILGSNLCSPRISLLNRDRLVTSQLELCLESLKHNNEDKFNPKLNSYLYIYDLWRLVQCLFCSLPDHDDILMDQSSVIDDDNEIRNDSMTQEQETTTTTIMIESHNDDDDSRYNKKKSQHIIDDEKSPLSHDDRALLACVNSRRRLELLSLWFQDINERNSFELSTSLKEEAGDQWLLNDSTLYRIHHAFHYLTSNNVPAAIAKLQGIQHLGMPMNFSTQCLLRLSLCLCSAGSSTINGSPVNHEPHYRQLCEWQRRGLYTKIPLCILRIHHVLAGCIDRLVAFGTTDWKSLMSLLIWYPSPDASLYSSIPEHTTTSYRIFQQTSPNNETLLPQYDLSNKTRIIINPSTTIPKITEKSAFLLASAFSDPPEKSLLSNINRSYRTSLWVPQDDVVSRPITNFKKEASSRHQNINPLTPSTFISTNKRLSTSMMRHKEEYSSNLNIDDGSIMTYNDEDNNAPHSTYHNIINDSHPHRLTSSSDNSSSENEQSFPNTTTYVDLSTSGVLRRAITTYESRLLQIQGQTSTPAPLPPHVSMVRRPLDTREVEDVQFNLLKLYSGLLDIDQRYRLVDLNAYSDTGLCVGVPWLLLRALIPEFRKQSLLFHSGEEKTVIQQNQHHPLAKHNLLATSNDSQDCLSSPEEQPLFHDDENELWIKTTMSYLDKHFMTELEAHNLWHWCIVILLSKIKHGQICERFGCQQIIDIICRNAIFLTLENHPNFKIFPSQITFLRDIIGLPRLVLSHVYAEAYTSAHQYKKAADSWMDCFGASVEAWDSHNKNYDFDRHRLELSQFILNSNYRDTTTLNSTIAAAPTYYSECISSTSTTLLTILPSPTSYLLKSMISLQSSNKFLMGLHTLCSYLLGHIHDLLRCFSLYDDDDDDQLENDELFGKLNNNNDNDNNKMKKIFQDDHDATNNNKNDNLYNKTNEVFDLKSFQLFLNTVFDDHLQSRRVTYSGELKLIRRSIPELCKFICSAATNILSQGDWFKSPLNVLCSFVCWIDELTMNENENDDDIQETTPIKKKNRITFIRKADFILTMINKQLQNYENNNNNSKIKSTTESYDNQEKGILKESINLLQSFKKMPGMLFDVIDEHAPFCTPLPYALTSLDISYMLPTLLAIRKVLLMTSLHAAYTSSTKVIQQTLIENINDGQTPEDLYELLWILDYQNGIDQDVQK